jgi:hypothetical protein
MLQIDRRLRPLSAKLARDLSFIVVVCPSGLLIGLVVGLLIFREMVHSSKPRFAPGISADEYY